LKTTENVFIEPCTPNPEPEETYPDDLYMEEAPELETLAMPPPMDHLEDLYMDTGKDPDPPEPPQLIAAPAPLTKQTTHTETTEHVSSGRGCFPQIKNQKTC
jgi:hypothetical protein